MADYSPFDPNKFLREAQSGKVDGRTALPMLAGMMRGVILNLFGPMTKAVMLHEFNPSTDPTSTDVRMPNGDVVRITLEVVKK